jgi:hypothetical protein
MENVDLFSLSFYLSCLSDKLIVDNIVQYLTSKYRT